MIPIEKKTLQFLTLRFIQSLDEGTTAYESAAEILLILANVLDSEGNLSDEYKASTFWTGGDDGTPLRPSAKAEIAAMLPADMRHLLKPSG